MLSRAPSRIDQNLLGEYPDFAEWLQTGNAPPPSKDATSEQNEELAATPVEALDHASRKLRSILEAEVLDRVRNAEPAFLEQAVVDLLIAMGYGSLRRKMMRG